MKSENTLKVIQVKKNSTLYQELEENGVFKHECCLKDKDFESFREVCSYGRWRPVMLRIIETDGSSSRYSEIIAVQHHDSYYAESTYDIRAPYGYLEHLIEEFSFAVSEWGEYEPEYKKILDEIIEVNDMLKKSIRA